MWNKLINSDGNRQKALFMPFIFYDTETTGIQTRFDQILQFAAIKTDDDFNSARVFGLNLILVVYIIL